MGPDHAKQPARTNFFVPARKALGEKRNFGFSPKLRENSLNYDP
jgi:hypothetical protein